MSTALGALRQSGCLKFLHSIDSLQVAVLGDVGGHDIEDAVVRMHHELPSKKQIWQSSSTCEVSERKGH
jgi:hypothetical protein